MIWLPILTKAGCTAFCVVFAASMAQRLGPFWGGLIATLPVSSGPAYVLLAMEHDAAFIETGSLGGYAANVATAVYLAIYGRLAAKQSPWRSRRWRAARCPWPGRQKSRRGR